MAHHSGPREARPECKLRVGHPVGSRAIPNVRRRLHLGGPHLWAMTMRTLDRLSNKTFSVAAFEFGVRRGGEEFIKGLAYFRPFAQADDGFLEIIVADQDAALVQ